MLKNKEKSGMKKKRRDMIHTENIRIKNVRKKRDKTFIYMK